MSAVIGLSFFAIYLGPLYGLIRDNSTFGEVVRPGDGKRKRWLRLRHHIQRPSEIAFFYENRSRAVLGFEGLIRWGVGFCAILGLYGGTSWFFLYLMSLSLATPIRNGSNLWVYDFHVTYLTIHGFGLALCALMFSHTRNTTYLRLPVTFGWKTQVSRLDTTAFLLLWFLFTAMSIATPYYFDQLYALPNGGTVFPEASVQSWRRSIDLVRVAVEGTAVISVAGLAVYALQRYLCLRAWTKTAAFVGVALFYFIVVCMVPLFLSAMFYEMPAFRRYPILVDNAPTLGICSPFMVMLFLFNELGGNFPRDTSTVPFYAFHGLLIALSLFGMYRQGRKLRQEYLPEPVREAK